MPKERGIHNLQPATPDIPHPGIPQPDQLLVRRFATGLDTAIDIFHAVQDEWVKSIGGKSYSEIAAISQYMFLSFVGATSPAEVRQFAQSPFARTSHLVWRMVAAIDDAVDKPRDETSINIANVTDTDGVLVTKMIRELFRLPHVTPITSFILSQITNFTKSHESHEEKSFTKAFGAKKATTGTLTAIGAAAAYTQLFSLFPGKTVKKSLPVFIQESYAGSLIAQLIDDIVDVTQELNSPNASSLVLAAAHDAGELAKLKLTISTNGPISVSLLLSQNMQTGEILSRAYQNLRLELSRAPEEMIHYFDNQFYYLKAAE